MPNSMTDASCHMNIAINNPNFGFTSFNVLSLPGQGTLKNPDGSLVTSALSVTAALAPNSIYLPNSGSTQDTLLTMLQTARAM